MHTCQEFTQGNRILLLKSGNCQSSRYIFIKAQLNRKSIYTVLLNEVKFTRLRRANPEEILREAQNDRCLQFVVHYSKISLSLYCFDAIAPAFTLSCHEVLLESQ
jgi:hypothetical protein